MEKASTYFYQNKLKSMGDRGREMVEREFDWKVIAEQLAEIYAI